MDETQEHKDKIEERKERVKTWLKNPYNLALVAILLFAFILRLYYFSLTTAQTVWWDEAEYLSAAKKFAFGTPYDLNPQRPPLFQFIAALFFSAGLNEALIKFSLVTIPSLFLVYAVYLLGSEMFDTRIGLIGALLIGSSWSLLFWTARFQPDFFSLSFQVLALYFMWKYWKKPNSKLTLYAGFFAALGFYFKVSALLVPLIIGIFIFIKDRFDGFKNKDYYYFALAYAITFVPYFIWSQITFGTATAFRTGYSSGLTARAFAWSNLNFLYTLTENILFVLFLGGVFLSLGFLFYIDVLIKDKKRCLDPGLFSLISILTVASFYIFYIRATEDRWVFLWLPFLFFLVGKSLTFIYDQGNKKYPNLLLPITGIIIIILAAGVYSQLTHADGLIRNRLPSYGPVRESGLWMKQNSAQGDIILTRSSTQHTYYSERKSMTFDDFGGAEGLTKWINENQPKYFVVSIFEVHPDWTQSWINEHQNRLAPVQAYTQDNQQPILIVYEIQYPFTEPTHKTSEEMSDQVQILSSDAVGREFSTPSIDEHS